VVADPRITFATAELAPLARVGGLAEAAAGLVRQLRGDGLEIDVVLPDYGGVELDDETVETIDVPSWAQPAIVRRGAHADLGALTLIATAGVRKPHPYVDVDGTGWPDNPLRFFGFSAAVAALVERDRPDVVHLNDWHTAAVPAFLRTKRPCVLTIHTLGYQGATDPAWIERLPDHREAYRWYTACNPLAGAIRLADRVIAVSPNYAREIVTEQNGHGLHDVLAARGDDLVGILNGIDVGQWDPATDPHLARRYTSATVSRNKPACRRALLDEVGLADAPADPVLGVVSRLVDQKGIDLLLETVWFLEHLGARLVVLGAGDAGLADGMRWAAATFPDRVAFVDGYDAGLAHRIFGGADLFVMPSRFEPCGLAQMQAMAYGTLPIVTDVGGLHDTVIDADRDPSRGTGIVAPWATGAALTDAIHRGVALWRDRSRRNAARANGMSADWSWKQPADQHRAIYRALAGQASEDPARRGSRRI
jgi:starch synthase